MIYIGGIINHNLRKMHLSLWKNKSVGLNAEDRSEIFFSAPLKG